MKKLVMILSICSLTTSVMALTSEAETGKSMMDICEVCHATDLDPPQAPPFYSIQQRYQQASSDKTAFIDTITRFMRSPTKDTALIKEAVEHFGRHPKLGFPDEDMQKMAAFIYENTYLPPCRHWQAGMKLAKKSNDQKHYEMDKKKFDMHCTRK